jgi:DNA repair exonuclease SbcCD ATPase subunit
MEFDELLITTGVDALVRLVKEKQRTELEEASSVLNIPQETIEDWARVLEEEGILRIEYRLTRIYLVWVKPTEEEVAAEKESFYEEKKGIETEVDQIKGKISSDTKELENLSESFGQFYTRVYGKMEALEKLVAPIPASKTISDDVFSKFQNELSGMEGTLGEIRNSLDDVRRDISSLGIGGGPSKSEELMTQAERLGEELADLRQEMDALRKKAGGQEAPEDMSMPSVKDIKKKFETMQKDLISLRSRNAQMRQDMLSLHESSEILKSVAESIMGQEDKIGNLKSEMASISAEADSLAEKTNRVTAQVKQNAELMERLGDSVDVAKTVLKKFPSQDRILEDLDKLKAEEDAMLQKTADLEKLLEAVGGRQLTAKQFTELIRKMEEKSNTIRKDMDALEAALQDEKSTYLTFQKIKERIVPSIEGYQQQLDAMDKKVAKIRDESAMQLQGIKADAQKLQESLKGGQVQDIVKVAEEIREKKKTLDEIRNSLDDLTSTSENLNKRVTLLSREAKLLEIRTGGMGGGGAGSAGAGGGEGSGGEGGAAAEERSVRKKLELTQEEELEFRRKRDELKKLIQRLWEE